jgi:hypothetical protein
MYYKVLEVKAKSAHAIELINKFDVHNDFNYTQRSLDSNKNEGKLKDVNITDRYRGLLD